MLFYINNSIGTTFNTCVLWIQPQTFHIFEYIEFQVNTLGKSLVIFSVI